MTTQWVLWGSVGIALGLMAYLWRDLWRLARRVAEVERVLRLTPVPLPRLKDPEPGSYALSDAEAAQVEKEQMVESQQRAQSRKARGSAGFSGSWRRG